MLSSTDSINAASRNHQSLTIRTQKPNNGKSLKEVVLHHPSMSPPLEDWVLFPDQVIHTKHSTVRESRARQAKKRMQPAEPSRSSSAHNTAMSRTAPASSRNTSMSSLSEEPRVRNVSFSALDRPNNINRSTSNVAEESPRSPPRAKAPQRLPTPDLSDVEEDSFWSCCGSSEGSQWDQMDHAIDVPTSSGGEFFLV